MWQPGPPATDLALAGAQLLVNVSASPFHLGKDREREEMFRIRARDNAAYVAFCNAVGGQDELLFDGHSVVLDDEGTVLARAPGFEEALLVVDVDPTAVVARRLTDPRRRALARDRGRLETVRTVELDAPREQSDVAAPEIVPFDDELEQMRQALVLGLGDYVRKNGFSEIVIGLSGGIDSALTAAIAAEAVGAERIHCVSMPSRYSSEGTRTDARRLAESIGCDFREIAIGPMVEAFGGALAESFAGREPDLTRGERAGPDPRHPADGAVEQVRLAARRHREQVGDVGRLRDAVRGHGRRVRALEGRVQDGRVPSVAASQRPRGTGADPVSIIERPPSAELRPDQRDEDSLPPYAQLDEVLEAYVEQDRSLEELSSDGFDPDVVRRAVAMIDRAEYKRRQAPPGVRLRPKAFGSATRRTPITNRWRS